MLWTLSSSFQQRRWMSFDVNCQKNVTALIKGIDNLRGILDGLDNLKLALNWRRFPSLLTFNNNDD